MNDFKKVLYNFAMFSSLLFDLPSFLNELSRLRGLWAGEVAVLAGGRSSSPQKSTLGARDFGSFSGR